MCQDGNSARDVDTSDESSDDELFRLLVEQDNEDRDFLDGMLLFAVHYDTYCNKAKRRKPIEIGLQWVERNLRDRNKCYNMFRMSPTILDRLHDLLVESYGLKSSTKSTSVEALDMFLWMLGAPQSVRQAENRFERSLGTIHNNFDNVLKCVVKLAADIIKPVDPEFRTIHCRLRNPRFHPFFNNCIGALDGTHIPVVVPSDKVIQHMCREGMTTQNVLSVCDFDMRFTFVLAGWPGSVYDMRVFTDAMTKYGDMFPYSPIGKQAPMLQLQLVVLVVETYKTVPLCREILPGGLWIPKPSRLSCALQENQVPSSGVSRRSGATR
jgi:hypothetical protein